MSVTIHLPRSTIAKRIFNRYKKVAYSAAVSVSRLTGKPLVDLAEEALSRLGELATDWIDVFDPAKSSACTWVRTTIYWHLRMYCAHKQRKREVKLGPFFDADDLELRDYAAPVSWMDRVMSELSSEGQSLLNIVLEAPGVLTREFRREPHRARMALMEFLRRKRWSDEKIDSAWSEVSACI